MSSTTRLLKNTWLYRTPKKKKAKKKKKHRLQEYASKLNSNLPKSEIWFQELWKSHGMLDRHDEFNKPYGPFIPDLINKEYYYIIEVDGSVHDLPDVRYRDFKKDSYYKHQFFRVFRVKAFDLDSFLEVVESIKALRKI